MTDIERYKRYIQKYKIILGESPIECEVDKNGAVILTKVTQIGNNETIEIPQFVQGIQKCQFRGTWYKQVIIHNKPDVELDLTLAFYNMRQDKISIQLDHPELIKSMNGAFQSCENAYEIEIKSNDWQRLTDIQYCFKNCASLLRINLGNTRTIKPIFIDGLFKNCYTLNNISVIYDMNLSKVGQLAYAFQGCTSLAEIDLSKMNLANLVSMKKTFRRCFNLKQITTGDINLPKLTELNATFQGCSNLPELDLERFKTQSLTSIEQIVAGCSMLKQVNIGETDLSNLKTASKAFEACRSIQKLDFSKQSLNPKVNMKEAFLSCSTLKEIRFPKNNELKQNLDYVSIGLRVNYNTDYTKNLSKNPLDISIGRYTDELYQPNLTQQKGGYGVYVLESERATKLVWV